MPPTQEPRDCGQESLRRKFSSAASALTELYRESNSSYEAGFRDALLFVHRYVLLASANRRVVCATSNTEATEGITQGSSSACSTSEGQEGGTPHRHSMGRDCSSSACPANVGTAAPITHEKLLNFLQSTLARRRERRAAARGPTARRPRSSSLDDQPLHRCVAYRRTLSTAVSRTCALCSSELETEEEVIPVLEEVRGEERLDPPPCMPSSLVNDRFATPSLFSTMCVDLGVMEQVPDSDEQCALESSEYLRLHR